MTSYMTQLLIPFKIQKITFYMTENKTCRRSDYYITLKLVLCLMKDLKYFYKRSFIVLR